MKILLQRVSEASVDIAGREVARIGAGLVLLIGFGQTDDAPAVRKAATRVVEMRVFPDERGRFQYSVQDCAGDVLLVPQFTLYGNVGKGRRPDFTAAMAPDRAVVLFDTLVQAVRDCGIRVVETGVFGADMQVRLVNDGPVTLMLDY